MLQGDRFNMHARAYFAVVTGTANRTLHHLLQSASKLIFNPCLHAADDSIEHIRNAERKYFQESAFFKEGVFSSRRAGTDNLSR